MSSVVEILVGGVDIADHVIFQTANFQSQQSAVPGLCEMTIRDIDADQSFTIGDEIVLIVDGVNMWGGYLLSIGAAFAFPAENTALVPFQNRQWQLQGVDYNILFDKRVLRYPTDYTSNPPRKAGSTMDGTALTFMLDNYIDVPAGFDTSTFMDDIVTVSANGSSPWAYVQQGTKMRDQFDQLSLRSAAVYYIDADKNFHYHAIESVESRWGFSDVPNYTPVTASPTSFQDAFWGFREVEATEDGSQLVNDALIWGGSEWAGTAGGTVFARVQDATSQADHERWQVGEVHIGEEGFGIQDGVDARANAIVLGPPGADAYGQTKGLRYSQWQVRCAWHDKDVPLVSGTPDHLRAGQLVTIDLQVFGLTKLLPLRTVTITFPEGNPSTLEAYVRFDGELGIQLSDPFTLWAALLKRNRARQLILATATQSSTVVSYGALGQFEASPTPDGVETVFTIPFGYLPNTTQVYLDPDGDGGLLQRRGVAYTESDSDAGEITFTSPPTGVAIDVICRTLTG